MISAADLVGAMLGMLYLTLGLFKDPDGNIFSLVTPPNIAARQTVGTSVRSTA
jgi:hypothetical protein